MNTLKELAQELAESLGIQLECVDKDPLPGLSALLPGAITTSPTVFTLGECIAGKNGTVELGYRGGTFMTGGQTHSHETLLVILGPGLGLHAWMNGLGGMGISLVNAINKDDRARVLAAIRGMLTAKG